MGKFFKQFSKKKTENIPSAEDILAAYAKLDGLCDVLNQEIDQSLAYFKLKATVFYASKEAHNLESFALFWRNDFLEANNKALEKGLEYLELNEKYTVEEYKQLIINKKPYLVYKDIVIDYISCFYSDVFDEFTKGFPKNEQYHNRWNKVSGINWGWTAVCAEEIKKNNFKPIHIVKGSHGECDTCLCYDEEFDVFFLLMPDDNYYHWNTYEVCGCSEHSLPESNPFTKEKLNTQNEISKSRHYVHLFPKYASPEISGRIE